MNPPVGKPSYPSETEVGTPAPRTWPHRVPRGVESANSGDERLLRRIADGDERALGELYDRWLASVHTLVARIVRDTADAEDVVEEVFWQAWRQAARYEPSRGTVATWLLTIARSRALDRLRTRQRLREETLEESAPEEHLDSGTDVIGNSEASERRVRVLAALDTLPPEQRQVLEMAYFEGMSQTEIADRTGQPLGTIKTRVRLAMRKLRDRLTSLREEARGS